jgi:hypothetical protein
MKTGTCQTEFKSRQLKQKVKVGQRLKEKCVNNETIKKRKNHSKLKRKKPPQKIRSPLLIEKIRTNYY